MTLTEAIERFTTYLRVAKRSNDTLRDYGNTFRKLTAFLGDPLIEDITPDEIGQFILAQKGLSNKTLLNYHVGLSSLWTWAFEIEQAVPSHIMRRVPRPKPEKPDILPYTQDEFMRMLASLKRSAIYSRIGKRDSSHKLTRYTQRNRAILFLLYDTGIRSSELCHATIEDLNFENRRLYIMGKGAIERHVRFSRTTAKVLQRLIGKRTEGPIFQTGTDRRALTRDELLKMIVRTANRAGVQGANVHRFRHTFAIEFLRNGGRPLHLKRLLGHSTMAMVDRYVAFAAADLDAEHEIASPVENLSRKKVLPRYERLDKTHHR